MKDALAGLMGLLFIVALVVVVVQAFRRKWKSAGIWVGVGVVCLIVVGITSPGSAQFSNNVSSNPKIDRQAQADAAAPAPATPRPLSRAEQKRAFLSTVNESISGADIAGNMYKYVGKNVDIHCTVANIPQEDFFNATCGQDSDGADVTLVIETDTKQLSPGQAVRVIGTVVQPMEGNNAMGGEAHFPTVEAEFME